MDCYGARQDWPWLQINPGTADDALDADGVAVLRFEQARAKARDWLQAGAFAGFSLAVHYAESHDTVHADATPQFRPRTA